MIKLIIVLLPIILLLIAYLSLINSSNSTSSYMNQQALAAQDSASRFPPNILIDSLNNIVMTNRKEASFSLYENPIYGIKILYPASWDKLEFGLSADGLIAGFVLPKEGKPPSNLGSKRLKKRFLSSRSNNSTLKRTRSPNNASTPPLTFVARSARKLLDPSRPKTCSKSGNW